MSKEKNNNRVRKGLLYTLYTVLGLMVLFVILLAAAPGFMLNTFGFRAYVAHYDQMDPTIKSGALVFVNRVDIDSLVADDMITFETNTDYNNDGRDDLATGYLDRTTGSGDSTYYYLVAEESAGDMAVFQSNSIVGGYAFSIPVLGLIVDFFGSWFGIVVLFVNAALITAIIIIVKHDSKDKKVEEKEI